MCDCVWVGGRAEKRVCVGDFVFGCDSVVNKIQSVCLFMSVCLMRRFG